MYVETGVFTIILTKREEYHNSAHEEQGPISLFHDELLLPATLSVIVRAIACVTEVLLSRNAKMHEIISKNQSRHVWQDFYGSLLFESEQVQSPQQLKPSRHVTARQLLPSADSLQLLSN